MAVTAATEPAAVAETFAAGFSCAHRRAVVLRFGCIVGDDPMTQWRFACAHAGHPVGMGDPAGWMHVVHARDVGTAVCARSRHRPGSTTWVPSRFVGRCSRRLSRGRGAAPGRPGWPSR